MRSAPLKKSAPKEKIDVREACLAEALQIISQNGLEALSLREVARRLNVSHQAPYKHFPSREHILAEVMERAFSGFTQYLKAAIGDGDPRGALETIGRAYLEFAMQHPLQYRLMFGTPLPDLKEHPYLFARATEAFSLLKEAIRAIKTDASENELTSDALFAWSTVHGLASLTQIGSFSLLGVQELDQRDKAIRDIMDHICRSINSQ
ncbi:MAG: TetR/AcrR family transcriptional regulator [Capsulimonas sp.]|uniref:TetR/AcrR family transcriptional regulator n=1 Tax=Capsulimonas sp. TaxID=2494211 RepID=UPI0032633C4B